MAPCRSPTKRPAPAPSAPSPTSTSGDGPATPPATIEWLLGPEPLEVLDLGAGTGKLTAALLAAGHPVTALEPLPEMRAILTATLPAANAIDGRAEDLPLADRSFDAVVAGSAFHWFDREPALDEIARVLRPPGVFGLLGNRFDTSVDWQRRVRGIGRRRDLPRRPLADATGTARALRRGRRRARLPPVDRGRPGDAEGLPRLDQPGGDDGRPPSAPRTSPRIDEIWDSEPDLAGRETTTLRWRTTVRRSRGLLPLSVCITASAEVAHDPASLCAYRDIAGSGRRARRCRAGATVAWRASASTRGAKSSRTAWAASLSGGSRASRPSRWRSAQAIARPGGMPSSSRPVEHDHRPDARGSAGWSGRRSAPARPAPPPAAPPPPRSPCRSPRTSRAAPRHSWSNGPHTAATQAACESSGDSGAIPEASCISRADRRTRVAPPTSRASASRSRRAEPFSARYSRTVSSSRSAASSASTATGSIGSASRTPSIVAIVTSR